MAILEVQPGGSIGWHSDFSKQLAISTESWSWDYPRAILRMHRCVRLNTAVFLVIGKNCK